MSAAMAQKRKPFGKSAENALNSKKQPIHKVGSKHNGRGGTSTTGFDPNAAESRRDSKTPKMGNLTSAGGAYNLNKELDAPPPRGSRWVQHVKTAGHRPGAKRDPSPTKLPDPTNAPAKSTTNRADKSTKRHGSSKQRDGFVAASLKRLFSSKDSTANQPRTKSNDDDRLLGSNHVQTSSHMKMVGLVTSPLSRPDPIAKDEGGVEYDTIEDERKQVELNRNQAQVQPDPRSKSPKSEVGCVSSEAYPPKVILEVATIDDQPRSVPIELLERFRNGPTDDKRTLDAMFKSGSKRPSLRPRPNQNEVSIDSLVGSMVGGASLQRSDSIDESEVTTVGFIHEDSSQASMTTRFDHVEADRSGVQSNFANKSLSSGAAPSQTIFRNVAQANAQTYQDFCRANTIDDRTNSHQNFNQQTYLPAGWKVRWSKTKQQPYWVHPDFGSTWHCPGLIPTVRPKSRQRELYHDQSIFQGMQIRPSDNPRLDTESDTASHMWRVLQDSGASVKGTINEYAIPMNTETTVTAQSIQTKRRCSNEYILNDEDADVNEEKRLHRETNDSEGLDVSSVEASMECLTQDFECHDHDEDEMKSVTESCYDETKRILDVEYEYDQLDSHDASDGRIHHSEVSSQEPPNSNENDTDESIDRDNGDDDGSSLTEKTLKSGSSSAINSLMSDYVDVDALLKNGGNNTQTTLATIKEDNQSSDGYRTSEDSDDDSKSLQEASKNLVHAFEELSDGEDASATDFGEISGMDNEVPSGIRFDTYEDDRGSIGFEKKRRHSSGTYGSKKKFFPPGPLCSLQFLEEIEKREFDTPLWRRMKRKRSTLTSVRAQNHRKRRSSFH